MIRFLAGVFAGAAITLAFGAIIPVFEALDDADREVFSW